MKKVTVLVLAMAIAMLGCGGGDVPDSETDNAAATRYVSIGEFNGSIYQDAIYGLRDKLNGEFYEVCGDTFCEGDYANLVGLSLDCAVSSVRGEIHDCAWTFTGSSQSVNPETAAIEVDAATFACHFKPKTTARELVALLEGSADALTEPLPGGTASIYDGLSDCFDHPIKNATLPVGSTSDAAPKYLAPDDYYASAAGREKWRKAKAGLQRGFDDICGDTFCEGDFGDLQSLDFTCAVTRSTGNVKACAWTFGGSYSTVDAIKGTVDETSRTWTCPVKSKGTIGKLVSTLDGSSDPIQEALPGETTSAYDAIGDDCLP